MNRVSYFLPGRCLIVVAALLLQATQFCKSAKPSSANVRIQQSRDLTTPVQKGSKATYVDLLRTLFPDLNVDRVLPGQATAHTTIPIKHIGEEEEGTVFEGDFEIKEAELRPILNQGRVLFLSLIDLTAENAN